MFFFFEFDVMKLVVCISSMNYFEEDFKWLKEKFFVGYWFNYYVLVKIILYMLGGKEVKRMEEVVL